MLFNSYSRKYGSYQTLLLCVLVGYIFAISSNNILAQNPNDCPGAIVICDNGPVNYTPIGPGNLDFSTNTCGTTEHQSAWYYFAFSNAMPPNQILEFTLTPNVQSDDYDFAMWGPDVDCSELDILGMIRCNFDGAGANGTTGLVIGGGVGTIVGFEEALTVNPNEGYYLMVDNFHSTSNGFSISWSGSAAPFLNCNVNPNCELIAITGGNLIVCDGDVINLSGNSSGGLGNENFNWNTIPESARQYIADTSAANTIANIPSGLFTQVEFVLTVTEGTCSSQSIILVDLTPPTEPTFTFSTTICEIDDIYVLPEFSDEGISGSWEPISIDPSTAPASVTAIFTPNIGQLCTDSTTVNISVESAINPEFDIASSFCELDGLYSMPPTSLNGIGGTWDPQIIDPSGQGGNSIVSIFTPDNIFCAHPDTVQINIDVSDVPVFNLPLTVCELDFAMTLPTISDNGIAGTWTIPVLDPSNLGNELFQSIFIPNPLIHSCADQFVLSIFIEDALDPVFILPTELCQSGNELLLPITSINGIVGSWSTPIIDPNNPPGTIIDSEFTPINTLCINPLILSFEIISPPDLVLVRGQDPSDCGIEDGIIEVESSSSPVEYSIDNGISWQGQGIFTGLAGGNYVVLVRNITLIECQTMTSIVLETPGAPVIEQIISSNITDCGLLDGKIEISSRGNGPLEYSIDDGLTWQNDSVFNGLSNQLYAIVVREIAAPACVSTGTVLIEIPSQVVIDSVDGLSLSDCLSNDGRIRIYARGENLEFSIDNGVTWQTASVFDNLTSGTYTIFARNTNSQSCADNTDIVLNEPNLPIIDELIIGDLSDCQTLDGSIAVLIGGGPFEYSIDNGDHWQTDSVFTNLPSGDYSVLIRRADANSCWSSESATIVAPNAPTIDSLNIDEITNCNIENGAVVVYATGENLEYSIDNGLTWQSNAAFNNLSANNYQLIVRSATSINCFISNSFIIDPLTSVDITQIVKKDVTDCLMNNGELEINVSGEGPMEYSIDQVNWQLDNRFTGLLAGTYMVFSRRIEYPTCEARGSVSIDNPELPVIEEIALNEITDCGLSDGGIQVLPLNVNYEYSIDNGQMWQDQSTFDNLAAGEYFIVVRDIRFNNCEAFESVMLIDPSCACDDVSFVAEIYHPRCANEMNGSIIITSNQLGLDFDIQWDQGQLTSTLDNLGGGMFYYSIDYRENCSYNDSVLLIAPMPLQAEIDVEPASCKTSNSGVISVSMINGGTAPYELSLNEGPTTFDLTFTGLQVGSYELIIEDSLGCTAIFNKELLFVEPVDISLSGETSYHYGDSINLKALFDPQKIDSVVWLDEFGTIVSISSELNEIAADDQTYYFFAIYDDCEIVNSFDVDVSQISVFYPNAFSPNNDGINDRYIPLINSEITEATYDIQIFDRWGAKVFEIINADINDNESGWDGMTFDEAQADGLYLYQSSVYLSNGKVLKNSGEIYIIK